MAEVNLKKKLTCSPEITELSVTAEKKIQLRWSTVPLAEKYAVRRAFTPDGDFELIKWVKDTELVDESVEEDTTYWYKIVACKTMEGKKTSKKASTLKVVTVSDIPSVKNLSSVSKDGKICLAWDKGEGDKYYIYRRCDFFSRYIFIGESSENSFVDERAISGKIYHYCVQTVKLYGEKELHGNFSEETHSAFIDTAEILSAKATLGNRAVLDIRIIAGADGYIFERSDKKEGKFTEVGRTEDITSLSFEEKLPSRFRNYYYRVCAYKKTDETEFRGPYSPVKSVR